MDFKFTKSPLFKKIKITFLLAIPITLWILPADFFDHGTTICLSKSVLDIECWGCGITRAIMHLMHFDFEMAYDFNKLSFIVLPILFLVWVKTILEEFNIRILKWL